jgi:hypothetical protein
MLQVWLIVLLVDGLRLVVCDTARDIRRPKEGRGLDT